VKPRLLNLNFSGEKTEDDHYAHSIESQYNRRIIATSIRIALQKVPPMRITSRDQVARVRIAVKNVRIFCYFRNREEPNGWRTHGSSS
jgi:hypothetical protein